MSSRTVKAGVCRSQATFLPPRVEDYVGTYNPVRAIEAYVEAPDLVKLKFQHADRNVSRGLPLYDPAICSISSFTAT